MKTALVLASVLASAAAFTPAPVTKTTALRAFDADVGGTPPLGFFDPLGLVADGDQANFDRLREAEVRHGRVSMLATVGWLSTAAGARLPGMEDAPFGFKAIMMEGLPMEVRGTVPLTLMTVFFLTCYMQDATGEAEFPGDYRNGLVDFGWDRQTDEWKARKRAIEINNGRAAMCGILGIMVHEQLGNLELIGLPQP